ncbi:hypothetical protein A0H81_14872 [Grifola frondosa]|uniref:Uncharacterized protein n=1 Tax=Grifola frondosa TaxID=5627 RepID=A0A1C7LK11_GRIFR|nr:hypothetical protein A0H81_14872 [Grifola frondosa]
MPLSARSLCRAASFSAACDSISLSDEPFDDIWLCVPRSARALRSRLVHCLPACFSVFFSPRVPLHRALNAVSVSGSSGIDLASRALSAISWPSTSLLRTFSCVRGCLLCLPPPNCALGRASLVAPLKPVSLLVSSRNISSADHGADASHADALLCRSFFGILRGSDASHPASSSHRLRALVRLARASMMVRERVDPFSNLRATCRSADRVLG